MADEHVWLSADQLPRDRLSSIKRHLAQYRGLHDGFDISDLKFLITKGHGATRISHTPSGIEVVDLSTREAMAAIMRRLSEWLLNGRKSYAFVMMDKRINQLEAQVHNMSVQIKLLEESIAHYIGG